MVKKIFITLLLSVSLMSCISKEKVTLEEVDRGKNEEKNIGELVNEKTEGEFLIKLLSRKSSYQPGEEVEIYAMLKYLGEEPKIEISHGPSPFLFKVGEKEKDITISTVQERIGLITTLENNKWYEWKYFKSGVLNDDPFVNDFFNNEGFPEGDYLIEVIADFHTVEENKYYQISTFIEFEIK